MSSFTGDRFTGRFAAKYLADVRYKRVRRLRRLLMAQGWKPLATDAAPLYVQLLYLSPCGRYVCKAAFDHAWGRFIKWAKRESHPNLPRVSKVCAWPNPRDSHDVLYVAVMERFEPLPFGGGGGWSYQPQAGVSVSVARVVRKALEFTKASDSLTPTLIRGKAYRALFEKMRHALGFPTDLHGYNMMMRVGPRGGSPTLVLLDPYS